MDNKGQSEKAADRRLNWVDVARGIGILAVVAGHVWTRGAFRDAMYSFHMPLFFLLSGMLSRPQPVAAFTTRQFAGQMRPYAVFLLLLILIDQVVERMKGHMPIFNDWPEDLAPILLGGFWLRGPFTIFWFVPCLMVARVLFNMALARWPSPFQLHWALVIPPVLGVAYILGRWTTASPLGLLSVPMAFCLLWVGKAGGQMAWRRWMAIPAAALAMAGLSGIFPTLNMKAADYGWPLLSIAGAIGTSVLIFALSIRLVPVGGAFAMLGRAALVIMYLHVAVIHYLTPYLPKVCLFALALVVPFAIERLIGLSPPLKRWLL
ncbi:fucose 4-O-acetylase-like acetyltransferase [Sphingobium sp. OAS761]|uniref:acyltransferase family protein n=1 Tax=Sphingobium sp. OAS761 TaxID=2817901 RepID=UPI00209DC3FF|nr:acyltransferase family protein [Sphingobium sp. OAS761]MCP1470874.1 fucose 4-O-acetylase-like acetyltransferase [Sphingobium sp. OAS761]